MGSNGNITLFTNDSGAAGGATDYVRDAFQDITLPATANSGLTNNANTNPLGFSFANDDVPKFGAKTLFIKDIVLVSDRSKWVNNKPTYQVIFHENFPSVQAFFFGTVSISPDSNDYNTISKGQPTVTLWNFGDGMGVTGVVRRVAFLVEPTATGNGTVQVLTDGVAGNTLNFSSAGNSLATDPQVASFLPMVHAAANETKDLHTIQFTCNPSNFGTVRVVGITVYFENSTTDIDVYPGTTYVDKSKITTTSETHMAIPAYGSSLGGKTVIYKTQTTGYAQSALSCSTVSSVAIGSSGTNLLSVTSGTGASFPAGSGIVVAQGTSMYVGSVTSVSTDTLTVSPTLSFGITNSIYRAWMSGPTLSINASLMKLAYSLDFAQVAGFSKPILDLANRFAFFGSNIGISTMTSGPRIASFLGASGFMQMDGYFSAVEIETYTQTADTFHATLSVNGTPAYGVNEGQTGMLKRTVFTEAGPGWNSFVLSPGASMGGVNGIGQVGIQKINFYTRSRDIGVTFGALADFETTQAYTERPVINATLMALGTHRRIYADQLYLKGTSWVRGATFGAAGGAVWYGSSTAPSFQFQYYGKNFGIVGSPGLSGLLTLDGVAIGTTFGVMLSVATEGFHTVTYQNLGNTCQIQAIDFAATQNGIRVLNNIPGYPPSGGSSVSVFSELVFNTGAGFGATNVNIRIYGTKELDTGMAYSHNFATTIANNGLEVTIVEEGFHTVCMGDIDTGGSVSLGASVDSTQLSTGIASITAVNRLNYQTVANGVFGAMTFRKYFRKGQVVRPHFGGGTTPGTTAISKFSITKG